MNLSTFATGVVAGLGFALAIAVLAWAILSDDGEYGNPR